MNELQLRAERGRALRQARERAGLKAQELLRQAEARSGGKFKLSTAAIYSYERGRVMLSAEVAGFLAPVLKVPVDDLLVERQSAAIFSEERMLLGGRTKVRTSEATHTTTGVEITLEIHAIGEETATLRRRRWSLSYDPARKRFNVRGADGTSPLSLELQREDRVIEAMPNAVDATKAHVGPFDRDSLFDETGLPLQDDDIGLMMVLNEPLLAGEIRSLLLHNASMEVSEPSRHRISAQASNPLSLGKDVVLELADFLPEQMAKKLVALWEHGDGDLDRFLKSVVRLIKDAYERALIEVLAHTSLKKTHEGVADRVVELTRLAGTDDRRVADAFYLLGRHLWYVKRDLPEGVRAFRRALVAAEKIGLKPRVAQILVYLARVASNFPDKVPETASSLIDQALVIAGQVRRTDIELLAKRAKIELLRREGRINEAISLGDQIVSQSQHYRALGGDVDNILDNIRVDLALSLRRLHTQESRDEAERYYQMGIDRGRDDSHEGMCEYLLSDLYIDRSLDALSEARKSIAEGHPADGAQLCEQAEAFQERALVHCERAFAILDRPGADVAAKQKSQRRLLFLRHEHMKLPESSDAASDELAVREQLIARFMLGVPRLAERYDPTKFDLTTSELESLLRNIFATRNIAPGHSLDLSDVKLNNYLRPGVRLCLACSVGDTLIVRIFEGRTSDSPTVSSVGWFIVEDYFTRVQDRLRHLLTSVETPSYTRTYDEAFDIVQRAVRTIQPISREQCDSIITVAPQSAEEWLLPLEWLLTERVTDDESNPPLVELPRDGFIFTTYKMNPLKALQTQIPRTDFTIFVADDVQSLVESQPERLKSVTSAFLKQSHALPRKQGFRPKTAGVIVLAHADEHGLLTNTLQHWRFDKAQSVILLFCASAHSEMSRGPFAEGLALTIRQQIGPDGILVASRLAVSLEEAVSMGSEILDGSAHQIPIAKIVTTYLQRPTHSNPFDVPWVIL